MPRWRLFYHVVWATSQRLPLLDATLEEVVRQSVAAVSTNHRSLLHAIGTMPDHVHVAISIPPAFPISKVLQGLKGVSSKRINDLNPGFGEFRWQPEYGILSFSENALPTVTEYVENQRAHHEGGTLRPAFEDIGEFRIPETQS